MSLTPNTRLGPYEIASPLGAGGMGEVYRAKDSRLDRDVAIKVLPEAFARDPERMARFQREAKVLASLNHPNIAAIYGFEEVEGKRFLVMELVEGATLADRLCDGALSVEDALTIGRQIAEAVEAAHERGIIHRDLKPANVKITPEGAVKVLDFGLAKAMTDELAASQMADSPTITVQHTRPGVVLGTAAYMSPEQARGKPLDKRTDIWSFGVVLYEALCGCRPFVGETATDLVAKILEREPDWSTLPRETPPIVQLLLRRCLAKDRNKRLRDIGDARVDLETSLTDPTSSGLLLAGAALADATARIRRSRAAVAVMVALALLLGGAAGWLVRNQQPSVQPGGVIRFSVDAPSPYDLRVQDNDGMSLALDSTGKMVAFAAEADGSRHILVREVSASEARKIAGTEGGQAPFFSPDGRSLGFFADGKLRRVPVGGGPPLTLCDSTSGGAVWLDDGTIVFRSGGGSRQLLRVSDGGGTPQVLATAGPTVRTTDGSQLVLGFASIEKVPGHSYLLASVWDGVSIEDYAIVSVSLTDGSLRPVVRNALDARFVAPDRLVFFRESSLLAVPFDPASGRVTGEAVQVVDGVRCGHWADDGQFAVSASGTLAYVAGGRQGPGRRLIRVDSNGKAEPLMDGVDALVGGLLVSPNGRDVAVITLRREIALWAFNLDRRSYTLINNVGESWSPVWTPDSAAMIFKQVVPGKEEVLVRKPSSGGGVGEPLAIQGLGDAAPNSFSPDGTMLLMTIDSHSSERREDIVLHRVGQSGPAEVILGTGANESDAVFSPDGKHFAHRSNEPGRYEVFVRAFPDTERKWQISTSGGSSPRWSKDGKRLFFLDGQDFMNAVTIESDDGLRISPPQRLFDVKTVATTDLWGDYDVLPDGSFVMVQPAEWEKQPARIQVVLNWSAELKKR